MFCHSYETAEVLSIKKWSSECHRLEVTGTRKLPTTGTKFQLGKTKEAAPLPNNTGPLVHKTILCSVKNHKRLDHMFSTFTTEYEVSK